MKSKPRRHSDHLVFISHATDDKKLAKALKLVLSKALGVAMTRIFVSSETGMLKNGESDFDQIRNAHRQAKAVVALMTPKSILRPWVIYESGAADFHESKPLFVVLANGATHDCLPSPMKFTHAGSLVDANSVQSLCRSLAKEIRGTLRVVNHHAIRNLVKLAVKGVSGWSKIGTALVAEKSANSPFTLTNLFDDSFPESAKREIVIIGQCLQHLTRGDGPVNFKQVIFRWLQEDRRNRKVRVLINNVKNTKAIKAWQTVVGEGFGKILQQSTSELRRWAKEAKGKRLEFSAKATDLVPATVTFVDPREAEGYMILTPVIHKPISDERPQVIIWKKQQESVFNYYYFSFLYQISDNAISII